MRVLFDYQAFECQSAGGISRSFAELCRSMANDGVECILGLKESDNVYLDGFAHRPLNYTHDLFYGKKQLFTGQWRITRKILSLFGQDSDFRDINQRYSIELLKNRDFDVFHPTFFDPYFLPYLKGKPFVLTIHDMIPELYPQYFRRDDFQIIGKRILAPEASAVIAVSETTKRDIVRILGIPEEKVHVIYHGCSFGASENSRALFGFPYILYIGDRYGYKNFSRFIEHSAGFLKRNVAYRIVCTGKEFSSDERQLFESLGISDRMVHHWVKSDEEFHSIYHYAACFVYPSGYEGFGIPILEAYASDCPVLLNRMDCFTEIAGDAAVYFSFSDPSDLAAKLDYLVFMSAEERGGLLNRQRERLSLYSWDKSAEKLRQVYESVCAG